MTRPHAAYCSIALFGASFVVVVMMACTTSDDGTAPKRVGGDDASAFSNDGGGAATDASSTTNNDASSPQQDAAVTGALFGFVGSSDGKVRAYAVDAVSGAWVLKKESSAGTNPSFLAFDPSHRRIVAVDESAAQVRSYAFDPSSGALTEVNSKPAGGAGTTHVSLDPSNKWVMVANYTGGSMSIFPIDANGTLGNASDTKTSGAMSHWAGTNPSGTHVFVPALGANVIAQYTLNTATGKLTGNGTASPPSNAGPRHLAFHPSESWAYLINEVAISVTTFDFDKNTGKLTPKQTISALPANQNPAGVSGAEIFVHPSGKHVYASTRTFNSIAQLEVNAADGTLTLVENVPTGGNRPRSFGVDPAGTLLFAGNQDLDQVVGFKVDAASGKLSSLGKVVDVPGPTFVGLARFP